VSVAVYVTGYAANFRARVYVDVLEGWDYGCSFRRYPSHSPQAHTGRYEATQEERRASTNGLLILKMSSNGTSTRRG